MCALHFISLSLGLHPYIICRDNTSRDRSNYTGYSDDGCSNVTKPGSVWEDVLHTWVGVGFTFFFVMHVRKLWNLNVTRRYTRYWFSFIFLDGRRIFQWSFTFSPHPSIFTLFVYHLWLDVANLKIILPNFYHCLISDMNFDKLNIFFYYILWLILHF